MRLKYLICCIPLWMGCSPDKEDAGSDPFGGDDISSADDSATGDDTDVTLPDGLNGELVDSRGPLPGFHAVNRDGELRGPADLQQGPSVVWFFPAAGTYG